MGSNVVVGGFCGLCIKNPFFNYRARKAGFFVKHLPRNHSKITPPKFSRMQDYIIYTNHQLLAPQNISRYLSLKRQIAADSAGSGQYLNYRCMIVCP
jgi:hypothetical protein